MKQIAFSKEEKTEIVGLIRRYFDKEMDEPIGALPAEFLLDFFAREIGPYFYRAGLKDAQAAMAKAMENFDDAVYELARADD